MTEAETKDVMAIKDAIRETRKKEAKLWQAVINEHLESQRMEVEALRESLGMSNECVRKCGHDWSDE